MGTWLFTTGVMRGSYTVVEEDGEQREQIGLDLCLGFGKGENIKEAAKAILTKAFSHRVVPASFLGTLNAFEIKSDTTVSIGKKDLEDIKKEVMKEAIQPQQQVTSDATAVGQECTWCGEILPPNAAGKFSHLKKHIGVLVAKEIIPLEDAKDIHSLKLKPNIIVAFQKAKDKGFFKE